MRLPLLGGSYSGFSTNVSSQEMINFYWEQPPKHELHMGSAFPSPGSFPFTVFVTNVRGMIYSQNLGLLVVATSNQVHVVQADGTRIQLTGTLDTVSGNVAMCVDPTTGYVMMVDGTSGYKLDAVNITKIVDADFPSNPSTCAYVDGFFLVNSPNTRKGKFQWSAPNDCLTWDALDTETLLTLDTYIRQILINGRDIWFFGNTKSEVWYLAGQDSDHPFQRIERIESGIPGSLGTSPYTLACQFDNTVMWVETNTRGEVRVVRANGYAPQVVSTPEISLKMKRAFAGGGGADPVFHAHVRMWNGHEFFSVTLTPADITLLYDASTGEWHQESGTFFAGEPTISPYVFFAYCPSFAQKYIVASAQDTRLWYISDDIYTRNNSGVLIERRITGPLIALENEGILRIPEVQLDIEEATLSSLDATSGGIITLSYSKDGGHTYSNGKNFNIGQGGVGQSYHTRLKKSKLGWAHLWNFRIYTNASHKVIIKGLYGRLPQEPYTGFAQAASGNTQAPLKK
jgi:hypothetical protein